MRVSISSSGLSSPTKNSSTAFDELNINNSSNNNNNIILPSAKQILENLNRTKNRNQQNKNNINNPLFTNNIHSNSCYDFLKLKQPESKNTKNSSSSESEHNTSSGVCNPENHEIENSSKNEENSQNDQSDSLSLVSSGFAKNGGASQFGSGTNLSQTLNNNNNSNKFSNILFASALLKAEKKRRIEQWIATLQQENKNHHESINHEAM